MGEEQLVVRLVWDQEAVGSSPTSRTKAPAYCLVLFKNKNVIEMKSELMKEMCPDQGSDIAQQTLPGRLTGRARDFDSRSAGSNPAPATNGIIA